VLETFGRNNITLVVLGVGRTIAIALADSGREEHPFSFAIAFAFANIKSYQMIISNIP
jgi:hypothetical protein